MPDTKTDTKTDTAAQAKTETTAEAVTENDAKKKHVLLVDDEPMILEVFSDYLRDAGYRVSVATEPKEAYKVLALEPVDLVVCDIRMPGGGGVSVLTSLKTSKNSHAPLIFFTGFSDYTADELIVLGAKAVIEKPVESKKFLDTIAQVLQTSAEDLQKTSSPGKNEFINPDDFKTIDLDVRVFPIVGDAPQIPGFEAKLIEFYEDALVCDVVWLEEVTAKEFEVTVYSKNKMAQVKTRVRATIDDVEKFNGDRVLVTFAITGGQVKECFTQLQKTFVIRQNEITDFLKRAKG